MENMDRALKRHRLVWRLLYYPLLLLAKLLYNYSFIEAPHIEGSYIVLPNHAHSWDHYFVSFSFKMRHMYFLASEHAFRKPFWAKVMTYLAGPISRVKGGADTQAVLTILRWLKKGVSICLFPEGNRTFNGKTAEMHPATAKLLRMANVPIVTYKLTGGYLSAPRWSKSSRRGRVSGRVVRVYSPEEIKKMSIAELNDLMANDLYEDAYKTQAEQRIRFTGARLAEGLEEALFICPKCGAIGSLVSKGSRFSCSCGFITVYDEYGYFDKASPFKSVVEWDDWQIERLNEHIDNNEELLSDTGASIWRLGENHSMEFVAGGKISLNHSSLSVDGRVFPLSEMAEPSLCHFTKYETLMFTAKGGQYELRFDNNTSRRKYCLAIIMLQRKNEAISV
jgi:1-acyl-sn-glycerol-3-phosphate acyltransferase